MVAFLIGLIVVSAVRVWQTGQLRFCALPLTVVPMWVGLRFQMPRAGMESPTIASLRGLRAVLWFECTALLYFGAAVAIDRYVLGHSSDAPAEPYQVLLYAPAFVLMFAGAYWGDRECK